MLWALRLSKSSIYIFKWWVFKYFFKADFAWYYYEIEIKGGIKYLALPAFKINIRAISALASSSPITIQTTSVLIFRHKTIFCLKSTKEELYVICHWIQKGPLNYNTFDTLKKCCFTVKNIFLSNLDCTMRLYQCCKKSSLWKYYVVKL